MLKRIIIPVLLAISNLAFSATFDTLPKVIDFSSFRGSVTDANYDEITIRMGYAALNYAPELTGVFSILKKDYKIDTIIETGTYRGASTALFSNLFDEVHTIEISDKFHKMAKQFFKETANVHCHLGSSENVLQKLLPPMTGKRILFYLDAHWNQHWPLLQELEVIGRTHKDNCIIVIDDFKVPNRPDILYDHYGAHECSYQYIEGQLNKVFSAYNYYYVIPKDVNSRAKFVAIPKSWKP